MATEQKYTRDNNGIRFQLGGINTVNPVDALGAKFAVLQNVRAYRAGQMTSRSRLTGAEFSLASAAVHSLRRLNVAPADGGPSAGFVHIGGSSVNLFVDGTQVDNGYSGNPLALIPFRPDASPEGWMYVGDSNKMSKVRSDGTVYKMGVKEPQNAPVVGTETTVVTGNDIVLGTARPWSNVSGANPSFNYSDNGNGTGSVVISTPQPGASLQLTATGTAVISGVSTAPDGTGPTGSTNPGQFLPAGPKPYLLGAWTDSSGNIVTGTGAGVVPVGAGTTLVVPIGATQFQLGVDGTGGAFSANTGQFNVAYTLTTSAVTTKVSLLGPATAYYWGDSPHSGPIANYIWRNPDDSASSGTDRTIGNAAGSVTGTSLKFDTTPNTGANPVLWDQLDATGAVISQKILFSPALESQGYQDFNACIVADIFIPAAGTYIFTILAKDNVIWGMGNNATWAGINTFRGTFAQTETVVSKLPLLPSPSINSTGAATTMSIAVTVNGPGTYPLEVNWDYWDKAGRTMVVTVNGVDIVPLSATVKTKVAYRYVFRSSATGATSNPSPPSLPQDVPSISNTITPTFSNDPQVDKVDYYRQDAGLDSFTYVGTGPNTNPPTAFTDSLLDQDVISNPLLEFDNFEPFPSIDLPRGGVVNVIGGVVTWVSGDQFNLRWLPGTEINIGGVPYVLYNRPSSTTMLLAVNSSGGNAADGTSLTYEIAEPILAGQPMASMWGDTDNTAYAFACGDPLRPGTLYFSKGNNLDSAPDTNQIEVTSPSEALVNGVMVNGTGMVFSAENGWVIYPNFSSALASVNGVSGSPFTLIRSGVTRGLYIRPCICTDGSGSFFYRSKDGIEASSGGGKQQSLTDTDLFNLFPHEGRVPSVVQRGDYGIVPPDDTLPEAQRLRFATGYLYYDYIGIDSNPHTLVYDIAGGGWVVDSYTPAATLHCLEEGTNANTTLVGCTDGSVRALSNTGTEAVDCRVYTGSMNGGDARGNFRLGDVFLRTYNDVVMDVSMYTNTYQNAISGFTPTVIPINGGLTNTIVDFTSGGGTLVSDVALALQWSGDQATFVDLWQPDWIEQPETTQDRPTDWTDSGNSGAMFWQGLVLEADTFNQPKTIYIQSADDLSLHAVDQNPVTFNGQSKQALTVTPPFIAHSVRIVSTDGVPWSYYNASWVALPFPESVVEWQSEKTSLGIKGWGTIRQFNMAYISTSDLTLTMTFDPGAYPQSIVLTIPSSGGVQAKLKVTCPVNKFKLVDFRLSSSAPFRHFANDMECKVGPWGRTDTYANVPVIGGPSATGAAI